MSAERADGEIPIQASVWRSCEKWYVRLDDLPWWLRTELAGSTTGMPGS